MYAITNPSRLGLPMTISPDANSRRFVDILDKKYHPENGVMFYPGKPAAVAAATRNCDNKLVIEINLDWPCVNLTDVSVLRPVMPFDRNVARVITDKLAEQFPDLEDRPRRQTAIPLWSILDGGSAWSVVQSISDDKTVAIQASVHHGKIRLTSLVFIAPNNVTSAGEGEAPNHIGDFISLVAEKLERLIDENKPIAPETHSRITIGLDYDGTVTSDPEGFKVMVDTFRKRGHKVHLVTMRYESECLRDPDFMDMVSKVDSYLATGRKPKRQFCETKDLKIDVWIDDNPEAVIMSADQIWGTASAEGDVVIQKHGYR